MRRPFTGWLSSLIAVGLVAALLAGASAVWEARQRQDAVQRLYEAQVDILTQVLADAALYSARAYNELETAVAQRLQDLLRVLNEWDRERPLTAERVRMLMGPGSFVRIVVVDENGKPVVSMRPPGMGMGMMMGPNRWMRNRWRQGHGMRWREMEEMPHMGTPDAEIAKLPEVARILRGEEESASLGFFRLRRMHRGEEETFGVVQKRNEGGALIALVDAQEMARLRSAASRDAMFEQVKTAEGILDATWSHLSDEDAGDVPSFRWEWDSVNGDPAFVGIRVFEDTDGKPAEIRVALDAGPIVALRRTAWTQGAIRVGLVALATLAATGLFFARQNARLLAAERDRIQADVRRLEEDARRNEKLTAMGELAAGVAHEIRNPLNAISMASQRLSREFEPKEDAESYRELLDTLRTQSARVAQVIDQFLTFARPEKIERRPGDIARTVRETAERFRTIAETRGVAVRVEAPESLPCQFDPDQITQVLENLMQNALDAQPNGGEIRVRLLVRDGLPVLRIEDDGEGIPPEVLDRVFDLYFTTKPNGNGLGLAVVQRIIAEHGGHVHLESEVGKGTSVEITFSRP